MTEESYEFDPCTLDGSDDSTCGFQSIDDWSPSIHKRRIPRSQWREVANQGRFDLRPGIDDLEKIESYIRKKYDDYDIMEVFGINAETLVAIKHGNYDPIDGISLDNQSKIYREFKKLEREIQKLSYALTMVADMFSDAVPTVSPDGFVRCEGIKGSSVDAFKMTIGYQAIKKKERQQREAEEARELAIEERKLKKEEPKPPKAPIPPKEKVEKPLKEKKPHKRVNLTFTKKGHLTKFE